MSNVLFLQFISHIKLALRKPH